jgi:hypothetical protein
LELLRDDPQLEQHIERNVNPEPNADSTTQSEPLPECVWRGIFGDYRTAMTGSTEASDVAHFAAIWSTIAAALGRSVYSYLGDHVYPNVYLSVFGASGDKKTTAMRRPMQHGLLADIPGLQVVRNVGTTEGLADALRADGQEQCVAYFFWEELSALLTRARWSGSTVLEFMTEAFDCPEEWGTAYRKNPIRIVRPTPTIIAGTTPEWFWKSAQPNDFYGGFGNRFLFLTGPKKPSDPEPAGARCASNSEHQGAHPEGGRQATGSGSVVE